MTTDFPVGFFRSWVRFLALHSLLTNKAMSISSLMRELGVTYSQLWKRVKELNDMGLIISEPKGRVTMLTLTKDGKKVAEHIDEIIEILRKLEWKQKK